MSEDEFSSPGSGMGIPWADYLGRLLMITPKSVELKRKTIHGERDVVHADVVVLDGPTAGEGYFDTLIYPAVLQSQLRGSIGKKVLGRVIQGVANPGQNPPWKLEEPTDADKAVARTHLAAEAKAAADQVPF